MKKLFVCVATLLVACSLSATVHNVKASDGAEVLKSTIAEASAGDTVLVQEGTFTGNFTMKDGVQVIGGWDETFTSKKDYATILDANADGRVLNQEAAFETPTYWENLTIQNGGGTTAFADKGGYGVYLRGNGGLRDCLVQNNKFTGTSGESNGGGVRVDGANAKFVALEACLIKGNQGTHAGGVCLGKGTMINCIVEENTTTNNATGGVTVQDGSFLLNSIIRNNNPKGDFGGVRMRSTTPSTVANCLIYGNVAGTEDAKKTVGGIGINDGVHYVYNNTIVGNTQTSTSNVSRCGLRINVGAGAVIANNIVWGNIAGTEVQADQVEINGNYKSGQAENFINNAVVIPADFGTNTILLTAENPGFFAPESGDFTLVDGSALIDAGADAYAQGAIDLAGSPRIQGKTIDLGCYETPSKYVLVGQDLQKALDITAKGDTLLVQAGTFTGNFTMKEGVNVSGGWNADFTEQTDYATILDGDAKGRVLNQASDFAALTVWSNFTIQNGGSQEAPSDKRGFGVVLKKNGRVQDCLIQNNKYNLTTECDGGGLSTNSSKFDNDTVAINCIVRNNKSTHAGGVYLNGKAIIINSIIENDSTVNNAAGGVQLHDGAQMLNCIVRNNYCNGDMGGVRLTANSSTPVACTVANCLIYGNVAEKTIGGLAINNGVHYVYNNTIVGNVQKGTGNTNRCGMRINVGAGAIVANNIVWGNMVGTEVQADQIEINSNYKSGKADCFVNNAVVIPADFGTNTILLNAENPGFFAPESGDFTLADGSALIDAGADAYAQGKIDLAGNVRIQGKAIDLGCYEAEVIKLTVAAYENAIATMNDDTIAAGDYYVAKGKEVIFAVTADEGYYIEVAKLNNDTIGENCEAFTAPATLTEDATLLIVTKEQSGTALINAKANADATKAKKVMVNGQLVVVKDNARYNVLGVKL